MKQAKTVGTVHTHTHTLCLLNKVIIIVEKYKKIKDSGWNLNKNLGFICYLFVFL